MGTIAARFVGHTAIPDRTSVFEHWQHSPVPQKARHSFLSSVVFPWGEGFSPRRTVLHSPYGLFCTSILPKTERLSTGKLTFVNGVIHRSPSLGAAAAFAPCSQNVSRRNVTAGRRGVRGRRLMRGSAVVAHRTHNPKVAGSIPAPATKFAQHWGFAPRSDTRRRGLLGEGRAREDRGAVTEWKPAKPKLTTCAHAPASIGQAGLSSKRSSGSSVCGLRASHLFGKDREPCPDSAFGPTSCQERRGKQTRRSGAARDMGGLVATARRILRECAAVEERRGGTVPAGVAPGLLTNPHRRRPSAGALQGSECLVAFLGRFYLPVNWPVSLLRAGLLF